MAKKAATPSAQRVVISIVYIFMGVGTLLTALDVLKGLFHGVMPGTTSLLTAVVGVITLLAGIFGLFKLKRSASIWMGVLIFAVSVLNLVFAVLDLDFHTVGTALMQAAIAWLYIVCV